MNTEATEAYGILTYIAEITQELAQLAERTGHEDLVNHLRNVGETAAQKVRHNVHPDSTA